MSKSNDRINCNEDNCPNDWHHPDKDCRKTSKRSKPVKASRGSLSQPEENLVLKHAIKDNKGGVKALKDPRITEELALLGWESESPYIQAAAVATAVIPEEVLYEGVEHENVLVRKGAARSKSATEESLIQSAADLDGDVVEAAIKNPAVTPKVIEVGMNNGYTLVGYAIAESPALTPELALEAFDSYGATVQTEIMKTVSGASVELARAGLESDDFEVEEAAAKMMKRLAK